MTKKDASNKMSDSVIIQRITKFGNVVAGSITTGEKRNTGIEPFIKIGRFTIRLFAKNNITECKIFGNSRHSYFTYPSKSQTALQISKCRNQPSTRFFLFF